MRNIDFEHCCLQDLSPSSVPLPSLAYQANCQATKHNRQRQGTHFMASYIRRASPHNYLAPSATIAFVTHQRKHIMARLEINVTGTGTAIRRAERGILILQAQSQHLSTAEEASAVVTSTANTLRDAIAPYCPQDEETGRTKQDAAIAHYSMSTLDTSSHYEKRPDSSAKKDEEVKYDTTYSARAEFNIKFSDFAALDKLATQFSAMQYVQIKCISWKLTDATLSSIEGSARKGAARNALQRARDYAEVFADLSAEEAVSKVKALHVTESSYYQQSTRPQLHVGKAQRFNGERLVDKAELRFEPEDVRLEVKVDGKFVVEM
jgi:predicted secreted protein